MLAENENKMEANVSLYTVLCCVPVYRCSAGTRGDTCEDIPDVCNVVNPCTTMGSCTNLNGTAECFCQISKLHVNIYNI